MPMPVRNMLIPIVSLTMLLAVTVCGATISGTVTDARGKVKGTVIVVFTRTTPSASGPQTGASGLDSGKFDFRNLAVGTYALCVQGDGHDYVDACAWSSPLLVTVRAANDTITANMALEPGVRVKVLVEDSKQLLQKAGRQGAAGQLEVGIWMKNGMFQSVPRIAHADQSATWEAVLPGDDAFQLQIEPRRLRLKDKAGRDVVSEIPGGRISMPVATRKGAPDWVLEYSTEAEGPPLP